ncbi:MAG: hypothetical protein HY033_08935 [Ignavibacteriae bacterium]|nr:hypothetical protein [Ignavibacteria bacterium]MBI3365016.1 hypothetical protein [Ignavibacteriota bacterium]
MRISHKSNKTILLVDALFAIFLCAAIYHLTIKPGLPKSFYLPFNVGRVISIDQVPVSTDDGIEFLVATHHIGEAVQIETEHPSENLSSQVILEPFYSRRYIVVDASVAIIFFVLGLLVFLFRPQDGSAKIFHFVSSTVAAAILGTNAIHTLQPVWFGYSMCAVFLFAYSSVPALFVHFTLVFPRAKLIGTRRTWLYTPAFVFALLQSCIYLFAAHRSSMNLFNFYTSVSSVFDLYLFISLAFGILNFIHSYSTAVDISEKRKLRWILFGLSAGSLPFIVLWVLPHALGRREWISEELFIVFLILIPMSFVISILKYRLMDIDLILNRSVVYTIVIASLLTVYAVVVGIIASFVGSSMTNSSVVAPSAAIIIALLFQPTRMRVQQFVDKRFFKVQYSFREAQRAIYESISSAFDIQQLADLIVQQISEFLPVERLGLFVVRNPGHRLRLLAHRGFEMLASHGVRFEMEQLKTGLHIPVALDDLIEPGIAFESADIAVFRRWGMAIVFTMRTEEGEFLGFLVLGEKKSGFRFTVEDVDLLNAVSQQLGLATERINLQQKLLLEQAESQRLEELNRMKSYFVSSVSHDLKTPLTSIKMFAELLQSKKKLAAKETKEYLEIIEGESDRLARLVDNVLDFARVEKGIKEYHFADVDMNEIICNVLRSFQYQFKVDRWIVNKKLIAGKCVLCADADAVSEALGNLISNALKYSSEKKQMTISTTLRDGMFAVSVKDKGAGISPEDQGNIFEPFFRARDGKAKDFSGAGLGLAVVKDIMDAHGGTVEVESAPGTGSTFTLLFPLKENM